MKILPTLYLVVLFCLLKTVHTQAQCASDSLELVKFYNATNGANWIDPWNLNTPMKTWKGVSLYSDGCVNGLFLYNRNMIGNLIDFNLPELRTINFNNNKLNGKIPNFSKIPNLRSLGLHLNQFDGEIPNFNNIPALQYLEIGECPSITGNLPNLEKLTQLTLLRIRLTKISGEIPTFNNLINLQNIELDNNNLSGNIPEFNRLNPSPCHCK